MAPRDKRPSVALINNPTGPEPPTYHHAATTTTTAGRLVFTSGIVGSKDGQVIKDLPAQVKQAFTNLAATLAASGCRPIDIVHLRFYVVKWQWTETEHLIHEWMTLARHKPPATMVPVPKLYNDDILFEVEAVAALGGQQKIFNPQQDSHLSSTTLTRPPPTEMDVIVVGAGFSGIQAAYDVHRAGLKVIVLEATHRVGGRSKTIKLASGPGYIELGATWINKATQPKIYGHVKRLGLTTFEQYNAPEALQVFQKVDGTVTRGRVTDPPYEGKEFNAEETASFNRFMTRFQYELTENPDIDINNTTTFPQSQDLSVSDWASHHNFGPTGERAAAALCRANVGREPEEVGIHYWADYVKSVGGLQSLVSDDETGAQNLFVKEGTSAIVQGLAAELPAGSVLVNSAVDEIEQQHHQHVADGQVRVTTVNGARFVARKVILANPTNTYTKINFSPPLPEAKRAFVSKTLPGWYAKVCLTYRTPWWRELGLLGKFRSHQGPICFSWELSVFDEEVKAFSLVLFIAGKHAQKWYGIPDQLCRQSAVLEHLRELLEGEEQRKMVEEGLLEVNVGAWSEEEWFGGAPTSAVPSGLLARYGEELRRPWKGVHFAGGETAREWKGYLEGALRAGTRAADEVIGLLGEKGRL